MPAYNPNSDSYRLTQYNNPGIFPRAFLLFGFIQQVLNNQVIAFRLVIQ